MAAPGLFLVVKQESPCLSMCVAMKNPVATLNTGISLCLLLSFVRVYSPPMIPTHQCFSAGLGLSTGVWLGKGGMLSF